MNYVTRLNDLSAERLASTESTEAKSDFIALMSAKAAQNIMQELSGRGGIDLFQFDRDIQDDIRTEIAKEVAFAILCVGYHPVSVPGLMDQVEVESRFGEDSDD